MRDLRTFLDRLRAEGDLAVVDAPVDPNLEIAEIHRRVIAAGGPALLFNRPIGHDRPVVTNLFGTKKRVDLAFGTEPRAFVERLRLARRVEARRKPQAVVAGRQTEHAPGRVERTEDRLKGRTRGRGRLASFDRAGEDGCERARTSGAHSGDAANAAAARPATAPLAQAHWKLKPPMRPSTSRSSPQR